MIMLSAHLSYLAQTTYTNEKVDSNGDYRANKYCIYGRNSSLQG